MRFLANLLLMSAHRSVSRTMRRRLIASMLAGYFTALLTVPAVAQTRLQVPSRAVVIADAPIFVLPDDSRVPLQVVKAGTILTATEAPDNIWLRVEFQDPQYGRRIGYIQARYVVLAPSDSNRRPPENPSTRDAPTPTAPAQPTTPRSVVSSSQTPSIGVRGYVTLGADTMSAKDSFNAVLGTSTLTGFGVGADVLNIWKGLFLRGAVSRAQEDGNRAFVFNGEVITLNVPITVTVTPIELAGGWRFPAGSLRPYVGGGLLWTRYEEESSFADASDNVSQTKQGFTAFGGIEIGVWKSLMTGIEGQYRRVPDALGGGPVSQDFGDTDLGGFAIRFLIGFSR
jgi:opacity protein-like surface antigen